MRSTPAGGSVSGTEKSAGSDGDQTLAELTNTGSPSAMSDISSNDDGSMIMDMGSVIGEEDSCSNDGGSLTDLFTSSINSIN